MLTTHVSFFYYWFVVFVFMFFPKCAYDLNKHVENHAYETYDDFINKHTKELIDMPAPRIAREYYTSELSVYTAFRGMEGGRRKCDNMLDVFRNIRDDEMEHVEHMERLGSEGF